MEPFYNMFFFKNDYRKMQLFTRLQEAPNNELRLVEASKNGNCNIKTMYSDFKELQEDLAIIYGNYVLVEKGQRTFVLTEDILLSKQQLALYYLKSSREFCLLDQVVQNQKLSIKEFKKNFHHSNSTFYKTVRTLNQYLFSLGITISLDGLKGDERMIRHFLVESYWSLFGGMEWPFHIEREHLVTILDQFESLNQQLNEIEKEKFLYWLAIIKIRTEKGEGIYTKFKMVNDSNKLSFAGLFKEDYIAAKGSAFIEGEFLFFKKVTNYIIQDAFAVTEECKATKNAENLASIETFLVEKSAKKEWTQMERDQFQNQLNKLNYYVTEDLIAFYYFLEPEAINYFNKYASLIEPESKKLLSLVPVEARSAYIRECKKASLFLVIPLRMNVSSKEGNEIEIEAMFKKYSSYPIEINPKNSNLVDMRATNFFADTKIAAEREYYLYFFDLPLTSKKVRVAVDDALKRKYKLSI